MKSVFLNNPLPYLALTVAHIIWGANIVVAKMTLEEFPVMTLGFSRFLLAFILVLPFLAVFEKNQFKIKAEHWLKLLFGAVFSVSLSIAFFFLGVSKTSAINASSLTMTVPLISVFVSWLFLKEKIYLINFLGIMIGLVGALVIIGLPIIFFGGAGSSDLLGSLLIILSGISGIIGMVIIKQLTKIYHPLVISSVFFFIGAVSFLIPAMLEFYSNPNWLNKISIFGVLGLIYMALMASVCAYFLYSWALQKIDIVKVALFDYINPAITASLAVPLLGERISFSFIIGTTLVVLGVYWGTLGKIEHHHFHHKHHQS